MPTTAPRVLVFQHLAVEHPGVFREFLAADGFEYVPVELDEGEPIPALDSYAALWVMGGPMDVWQIDAHPWLIPEMAAIRTAVLDYSLPFLGFCLGHQLLAAALGGAVGLAREPEVGILPVQRTVMGCASPYFAGLDADFEVLQWHSAEVTQLPRGAACLASSPRCAVQAMSVGQRAFSMQFHVEISPTTVTEWSAIPAYRLALERSLGVGGAVALDRASQAQAVSFNALARRIYENWRTTCGLVPTG
ncbi:MAG: type 1 glutamine amidotransferase [Gammaproteobacteria bacterium]|nr:type 1 glutamine amidotransferase [Gammaproteobacteria bacterium]